MTVKGGYSGSKGELAAFDVVVSPHRRENLNRSGAYIDARPPILYASMLMKAADLFRFSLG